MIKKCLYIVLWCSFLNVSAQDKAHTVAIDTVAMTQKKFDADAMQRYRDDASFQYEIVDEAPSLYEQISEWFNRVFRKILSWFFDDIEAPFDFLISFFELLPYIIAAIVLYLIVNFFLKVNTRNIMNGENNKEIIQLKDDEELLHSTELPELIVAAVAKENYRLATRYQYLLLLQQLSDKKIIAWEQQKTNEDYIKEIQHKNMHVLFENITRFYDFVWYGNFEITKEEYLKGIGSIDRIVQKIT